jgi:ABC-type nitrate/sulfonate/bicarbonate transport system permease component
MRVNIAATWNLVVVAELIAAQEGLGYRITRASASCRRIRSSLCSS